MLWLWMALTVTVVALCWLGFRALMRYVACAVVEDPSLLRDPEVHMMMRFVRRIPNGDTTPGAT